LADPGTTAAAGNLPQAASPELWATMLKSFGMLLLVLAVLIMVLWLMRRYFTHSGAASQQGVIRMIASLYVAPKERIALVEVLGEKLLLGITPQQISFLARIEDEKDICEARLAEDASAGFFKAILKRKLRGADKDPETKEDGH
jgi:flagellar protein FliO/FliZ